MAIKNVNELTLNVPQGANAHLMWCAHDPPKPKLPIAKVGYWRATSESGDTGETVWFDVNGDLDAAQAVLDNEVAPSLREAFGTEPERLAPVVVIDHTDGIQAEEASEAGRVLSAFSADRPESKRAGKRAAPQG